MENKFNGSFLTQQQGNALDGNVPINQTVESLFEHCLMNNRVLNLQGEIDEALDNRQQERFRLLVSELSSVQAHILSYT
ncbi:IDEAL domain-containing protein [Brochothrix campestris]|uniref:IDEAL domain-containing protein n=1 Tax=Brochothrix campestris FSL F6-1037 TaxID=1265861 RepID=W7CV31_9LIST|nr:IDEAL domain-containing protein [Brochothrix campestris]EUJ40540.1 hypothetical protein BCAMP_04879 [Brochothrix campestris FSL F6-1037]